MPLKLPQWHWTHRYDVSSKGLYVITVYTLDGLAMEFTQAQSSTGHDLLQFVAQRLELDETRLFGFRYELANGTGYRHLLLNKSVRKQLDKHATGAFLLFSILFYVEQPQLQPKEVIRHQYYLQLRHDLARGLLQPSMKQAIKLAIYALQADFGDFVSEEKAREVWKKCRPLSPDQFPGAEELASLAFGEDILYGYQHLTCLSSVNAQWYFLDQSRLCVNYGLEVFYSTDRSCVIGVCKRGISLWWRTRNSTNSSSTISGPTAESWTNNSTDLKSARSQSCTSGVSTEGVLESHGGWQTQHPSTDTTVALHLKWEDIKDFAYTRKVFTIQQIRRGKPVQVVMSNHHESKYLWKYCIEVHKFNVEHLTIYGPTIVSNASLPQLPDSDRGMSNQKVTVPQQTATFFGSKSLMEIQKVESLPREEPRTSSSTLGRGTGGLTGEETSVRVTRPLSTVILSPPDQQTNNSNSNASSTQHAHSTSQQTPRQTTQQSTPNLRLLAPKTVSVAPQSQHKPVYSSPRGRLPSPGECGGSIPSVFPTRPSGVSLTAMLGNKTSVEESFYDNLQQQRQGPGYDSVPSSNQTPDRDPQMLPIRGLPPRAPPASSPLSSNGLYLALGQRSPRVIPTTTTTNVDRNKPSPNVEPQQFTYDVETRQSKEEIVPHSPLRFLPTSTGSSSTSQIHVNSSATASPVFQYYQNCTPAVPRPGGPVQSSSMEWNSTSNSTTLTSPKEPVASSVASSNVVTTSVPAPASGHAAAASEKLTDLLNLTKMQKTPLSHRLLSEYQNHSGNSSGLLTTTSPSGGRTAVLSRQQHYVNEDMMLPSNSSSVISNPSRGGTGSGYHSHHHTQGTLITHSTDQSSKSPVFTGSVTVSAQSRDNSSSAASNATFCINSSHEDDIQDTSATVQPPLPPHNATPNGAMTISWNGGPSQPRSRLSTGSAPGLVPRHRQTKSNVTPSPQQSFNASASASSSVQDADSTFPRSNGGSVKSSNAAEEGSRLSTMKKSVSASTSMRSDVSRSQSTTGGISHTLPRQQGIMGKIQRLFKRNQSSNNLQEIDGNLPLHHLASKSLENLHSHGGSSTDRSMAQKRVSFSGEVRHLSLSSLNDVDLYADPRDWLDPNVEPSLRVPWICLTDDLAAQVNRWDCHKKQEESLVSKLSLSNETTSSTTPLTVTEELLREFSRVPQRSERHQSQVGQLVSNAHRNGDLLGSAVPYDFNRVRLRHVVLEETTTGGVAFNGSKSTASRGKAAQQRLASLLERNDYVNASHVKLQVQVGGVDSRMWMIVAAALYVQEEQQLLFWSLVWHENVQVMLLLAPKQNLDSRIFPVTQTQRVFGTELVVELEWSRESTSGSSTEFCFHLTPTHATEYRPTPRKVYLFHYHNCLPHESVESRIPSTPRGWTESGCVPLDPTSFLELLDQASTLHRHLSSSRGESSVPLCLVSCGPGWFDHGTVLLCLVMRWMLDHNVTMSSAHLLGLLRREGYMRLMGNAQQYAFVLACVVHHLQRLRLI